MASTEDITLNGVPPKGEYERAYGDEVTIYDNITLGDYDSANDGNGNSYDVPAIYGLARLLYVDVTVDGSDAYYARYDKSNSAIRVYDITDGSEVIQGTTLNIDLNVRAVGTGH